MSEERSDDAGCGPSSVDLKINVVNFMERADEIVGHSLATMQPTMKLNVTEDVRTGEIVKVDFDMNNLPREQWLYLAVRMRSIIFVDQDPISLNVLTQRIEREHQLIRGQLKPLRAHFQAWKKHAYVYAARIGTAEVPLPPGETRVEHVAIGPPGVSPTGVSLDDLSPDYEYANAYLNANAWHSDTDKAIDYQTAGEQMKKHYEKCAEIRVVTAIAVIGALRQWIINARAEGHDF